MLSSDGLSASQAMDYASSHPSSRENQSLFRSDLRGRIGIPLASSDPGVPLFNLSILDQRIDSLRRFLSRVIETHASIGDEQIDLVSKEIGFSIHQIILNGAALLATSQNQSFGPGVGGWTGSITEKMPDMVDPRAPPMSSFAEEVHDPTKGKASEPSDLRDLTIKSPYLVDREFLRNPEDLRIPSAVQEIADLKFSFCSDSRNLKIPAAGDGNPADPKFPEKSTASRKLSSDSRNINLKILADQGIQAAEDRNLIGLKFQEKSTISRNLSGNTADLKPPFSSDSRNLKIPAKQVIPAAADGNLVDLKDLEESTTSRNLKNPADGGGKDDDEGDDTDAEIIELDSVELLAEHTHFCDICGKGFKRDANLRMHKRAHGNQFKTVEALSKPDRYEEDRGKKTLFSCPFAGCNRNKSHRRFRPLKSAVCVKNHFKRSHCPKMYSCNRCNQKSFSVVSDLKSHLKHCGECRWRCSCGTSFSRKDKLFGHVALFEGHMPAVVGEDQSKAVDLEEEMQVDREEHVETADAGVSDFGFFDGLLEGFGSIEAGSLEDLLGSL